MALKFTQKLFDTICERIAEGESLRDICDAKNMPNRSTVFRWLAADEELCNQYARAREAQGDGEFDEIRKIATEATPDNVQVARLQIDALKWRAGKLRPKVYGDKLDLSHSGSLTINLDADADDL